MKHPRVVSVRIKGAQWDVYIGRGLCPRTSQPAQWGNPYRFREHGPKAMVLYLDHVERRGQSFLEEVRVRLSGKVLGCWCAPRMCHGYVLARIADGDRLDRIREAVLAQLPPDPPRQADLFA